MTIKRLTLIIGTDWWEADLPYPTKPYLVRGCTGVTVATLVALLRAWSEVQPTLGRY